MPVVIPVTYLFDPLCGWCYGASPMLEQLAAPTDVAIAFSPTGLFADGGARSMDDDFADYAWRNDQRIAGLTGQPFSEAYRRDVLGDRTRPFDSGPATRALVAVELAAPDRLFDTLRAIQKSRYVDGHDVTDSTMLGQLLRTLGLRDAATRLETPDAALAAAYSARLNAAQIDMRRFGVNGVPALIAGVGNNRRLVPASALFGEVDELLVELKAA